MPGVDLDDDRQRWRLAPLFFAAGGLALTTQVVLLRELMVALQGDETSLGLGLSAWLAGIAAGAGIARALTKRRPGWWAAAGIFLLAVAAPLEVVASRLGRWILAPPPGELLPLGPAIALAVVVLALPGCLVGLTFTALATTAGRAGWRAGQGIAWLYVLESLGSLAAGLLVTFLVVPLLDPMRGILVSAAVWVLVGVPAVVRRRPVASNNDRGGMVPGRVALPVVGAALMAIAVLPLGPWIGEGTVRARFQGLAPEIPLLSWDDTPYQHVAIGGGELRHLYAGGQYAGSFPDPSEHEALAHRLASLAPTPGSVLLIGGGLTGMLRHLLDHPFERIDLVEIDSRALRFIRSHLPMEDDAALDDPRVRLVIDDPRRFLSREAGEGRYDLILILEPPPVTLLLARMSTVEFYRLCADRLAPNGALAVLLETAPNVLMGETAALGGALWGALREVFPVVRSAPGPDGLLLAGTDPEAVTLDPRALADRFERRGIASEVFVTELFSILFPPERVAGWGRSLEEAAAVVPASRDEHPVSFLHALALRQQYARSMVAPLFVRIARTSPRWLAAAALLPSVLVLVWLALAAFRWRGARRLGDHTNAGRKRARTLALAALHAVVVTGGCGMAWSLLILFSYQTRAGALYGQIGLLAALFMLGLALGGLALARVAEFSAERVRRWLAGVTGAALLYAFALPLFLRWLGGSASVVPALPELLHGALLTAAGVVTGALFPVAAGVLLAGERGARETAAGLEAGDHAGAALAALLGGVVLIPALGLIGTAWVLVCLEGAALLGVMIAWISGGMRGLG